MRFIVRGVFLSVAMWLGLATFAFAQVAPTPVPSSAPIFVTPNGATTSRSLSAITADTLNAADFGAKCDGVTDDTAAINAAAAVAAGQAPLQIGGPGLTCMVSLVTLPSNSNIIIDGTLMEEATGGDGVIALTGTSNISISGAGTINGNSAHVTCAGLCPGINSNVLTNGVLIQGITIINTPSMPVNLAGSNMQLTHLVISNGGDAAEFTSCTACYADHLNVQNMADGAFDFYGNDTYGAITDSYFANNLAGPGVYNDAGQTTPSNHILIARNTITGSTNASVGVSNGGGASGTDKDIRIEDNQIYSNPSSAGGSIYATVTSGLSVQNNHINHDGAGSTYLPGIYIASDAGTIVSGNNIWDEGQGSGGSGIGISIGSGMTGTTTITGNQVYDDQGTPTMQYGIGGVSTAAATVGTGWNINGNHIYNIAAPTNLTRGSGFSEAEDLGTGTYQIYDTHVNLNPFSGDVNEVTGTPTGVVYFHSNNTGGDFYSGMESVGGGSIFLNTSGYSAVSGTSASRNYCLATANTCRVQIDTVGDLVLMSTGSYLQFNGTSGPKWTPGSGAPSGACTNGSFYTRTDGSAAAGATSYDCRGAAWQALSGG